MSALFGGAENFVPAFQGRQLAIQSGQGAGQSISRGQQVAQRSKEFEFEKTQYDDTIKRLNEFSERRRRRLGSGNKIGFGGPGDFSEPGNVPTDMGGKLMEEEREILDFFLNGRGRGRF